MTRSVLPSKAAKRDVVSMAVVVMCAALHLAGLQWQQRARPIQGLNLRFLIDAQDQRFIREAADRALPYSVPFPKTADRPTV